MSDIDYRKLRNSQTELLRKGSFPFPSYAEALFSQVLITRKPLEHALGKQPVNKAKTPVALRGPEVAQAKVQEPAAEKEPSEKKELLQSLGRFVEESSGDDHKVSFSGGEVRAKAGETAVTLEESQLISSVQPRFIDGFGDETRVLFVGECPKDYKSDNPNDNLLSKMIGAMKLPSESYCRTFITKDSELAQQEWYGLLKKVPAQTTHLTVVSLGALATNTILHKKERLSRIHGKEFFVELKRKSGALSLSIFPVFHPDILQINPNMKRSAWLDLQKVMEGLSNS